MGDLQVRLLKRVDRLLGRSVYRLLLRYRASHPQLGEGTIPESVRSILVIRPGGIGDAVLLFPCLHALRSAFPQARIEMLAERRNVGIFEANTVVDAVHSYDRSFGRELLAVTRRHFDIVIDTEQYHFLSAIIAYLIRAPVRCGFDTQGRGGLFTHQVPYSDQTYEALSFLNLVQALTGREYRFDPTQPFFPLKEEDLSWARALVGAPAAGAIVVLSPGASMPQRRWTPKRYRAVVQWLLARNLRVVIIGGAADVGSARKVARGFPTDQVINLAGATSLARAAAVIAQAVVYVSADTGPLHMAFGVGTPSVHLFGSGILEKWAPFGPRYRLVHKALSCSPCTRYGYTPPCPYDVKCMKQIEPEDVTRHIAAVLDERPQRTPSSGGR